MTGTDPISPRFVIPPVLLAALENYAGRRQRTGGFLQAVLENNLHKAVVLADPDSLAALKAICQHVYNGLPGPCWGTPEKVEAWLTKEDPNMDRVAAYWLKSKPQPGETW